MHETFVLRCQNNLKNDVYTIQNRNTLKFYIENMVHLISKRVYSEIIHIYISHTIFDERNHRNHTRS